MDGSLLTGLAFSLLKEEGYFSEALHHGMMVLRRKRFLFHLKLVSVDERSCQ